jgi:hypothetical protein
MANENSNRFLQNVGACTSALAVKQVIVHPDRIEVEVYGGKRLTVLVDDLKRRQSSGNGGGGGGGSGSTSVLGPENERNRWSEDPGFVSGSDWLRGTNAH